MRKKTQWGVRLGKPNTDMFAGINPPYGNTGCFVQIYNCDDAMLTYSLDTRKEARVAAKLMATQNQLWNYHAAKIDKDSRLLGRVISLSEFCKNL